MSTTEFIAAIELGSSRIAAIAIHSDGIHRYDGLQGT